jgi:WhiB family transcriptional regulator, redox-sensing transcriptional regulator
LLEQLVHRPSWHALANCKGLGVDQFVVGRGGQYEAARSVCESCAVRRECLETALANPDLLGMWGGTSEVQRKSMRRATGATPPRRAATFVVRRPVA